MKYNVIKLRNKICHHLQKLETRLGLSSVHVDPTPPRPVACDRFHHRFIRGYAKGGKALLIYPMVTRKHSVPRSICEEMERAEMAGAVVGCAETLSDAWDVAINDPVGYTRTKKTWIYQYWLDRYRKKEQKHGRSESESSPESDSGAPSGARHG